METAKVDIRKLQLLNDRINQCIDALAQVRLSVHGLQHSNPMGQMGGFGNIGSNPYGQSSFVNPLSQQGGGLFGQQGIQGQGTQGMQNPWQSQPSFGQGGSGAFGLSHTSPDILEYSRPTWADPSFASRVYQTFPYAQLQVPPVVSLY